MKVHLDPHTGQTLAPEQVPAYLTHPSNHGRVVQLVPMLTISPLSAATIRPLAGETPGAHTAPPGTTANQQATHARWS